MDYSEEEDHGVVALAAAGKSRYGTIIEITITKKTTMKYILLTCLLSAAVLTFAQDTTKTNGKVQPVSNKRITGLKSVPKGIARKPIDEDAATGNVLGGYTIEKYTLIIRNSDTKKLAKITGSQFKITEEKISGSEVDEINLKFSDIEFMETADYLYRVFGEMPETIPDDLPATLKVHRTNNLDCYGIAELSDRTIIMAYKGALVYLTRI